MDLSIGFIVLILSFSYPFSVFRVNLCRGFLRNKALIMACLWRMNDCYMGLEFRLIAFILLFFFSIFLSFRILYINIENLCHSFLTGFSGTVQASIVKHGTHIENK